MTDHAAQLQLVKELRAYASALLKRASHKSMHEEITYAAPELNHAEEYLRHKDADTKEWMLTMAKMHIDAAKGTLDKAKKAMDTHGNDVKLRR